MGSCDGERRCQAPGQGDGEGRNKCEPEVKRRLEWDPATVRKDSAGEATCTCCISWDNYLMPLELRRSSPPG